MVFFSLDSRDNPSRILLFPVPFYSLSYSVSCCSLSHSILCPVLSPVPLCCRSFLFLISDPILFPPVFCFPSPCNLHPCPTFCLPVPVHFLKGTVSRDFRLLVFFMNQFPPSIRVYQYGLFDFFRKFTEIFAAQGAPPVSTTPVANGKNLQAENF